ncbi:MAG: ankyrin repeat domain-containing protein [Gemmatimonadota bacterium]|nr:ankyrin repeat domain-containing protein [Gemmatimonadota bacterium]
MSAIGRRKRLSLTSTSSLLGLSLLVLLAAKPADSPVADAAQQGDAQIVRTLLQQGEDVNAAQSDGLTALHWAALHNDLEMAKLLLYAGATVKPTTRVGSYTPLHLASRSGYHEVMSVMLDAGADPNKLTSTGVTPMHFAAQSDAPEAIRVLVEHGGDLNMVDGFFQRTPLMFAAVKNATKALEVLVELGSDLEVVTRV